MKHKKLIYSGDIMGEFNTFFDNLFKVIEVGVISTTLNRKEILFCKCPYDGQALNKTDGTIYLKYENEKNEQFILLENETIIIENDILYTTCDTELITICKGDINKVVERAKKNNKQ
jgi:hypothetical protein